jgi:hypothetical protein
MTGGNRQANHDFVEKKKKINTFNVPWFRSVKELPSAWLLRNHTPGGQ